VAHVFQKNDEHPTHEVRAHSDEFLHLASFHGIVYCVQIKDHDSLPFFFKHTDVLVTKLKCCSTAKQAARKNVFFLPPMCVLYDSLPAAPRGVGSKTVLSPP